MKAIIAYLTLFKMIKVGVASEQYRTTLMSLKECENPELPYPKRRPIEVILEPYNTTKGVTLIRGHLTAKDDVIEGHQKGAFSYGFETPTGISWVYELKNLDCFSLVIKIVTNALNIHYTKKCMIKSGRYDINRVDVDKIDHALQGPMARKYGVWVAIVSFYTEKNTLTCWKVRLNVQPVKAKKSN